MDTLILLVPNWCREIEYTNRNERIHIGNIRNKINNISYKQIHTTITHTQTQSSKARGGFGQERYEKEEMQELVRKNFQAMKTKSWTIIDAKQSIEELSKQIHDIAKRSIAEASEKPLGRLWKY